MQINAGSPHDTTRATPSQRSITPLLYVSIERNGISLGAARIADPEVPQDAIALFCGPLAERDWAELARKQPCY